MILISAAPRRFATANRRRLKTLLPVVQHALQFQPPAPVIAAARFHGARKAPQSVVAAHSLDEIPLPMDVGARAPVRKQENVDGWEANVRTEEEQWLLGKRDASWWTGPVPEPGKCAGVLSDGTITSLPLPSTHTATRRDLLAYFDNTWALTEVLFSALQGQEAFFRPPYHQLRHPMIFYYGHPAVLYVNKMRLAGLLDGPVDPYFESIFEVGVDEMTWDDMNKNEMLWPSVSEVRDYRQKVYQTVRSVILQHPAFNTLSTVASPMDSPFWSVVMGFEHERIHVETSSVLMRELPEQLLRKPEQWPAYHPYLQAPGKPTSNPKRGVDYPATGMVAVEGGDVTLGKPQGFPSFGWDNEYGQKQMTVKDFRASEHKVTNGWFYEFVADGGYFDRQNWTEAGWGWRSFRNTRHPTFWVPIGPSGLRAFKLRTVFEAIDMPWANPVDVNYHEAVAFCKWFSRKHGRSGAHEYRLTTEAEHHKIRDAVENQQDAVLLRRGDQMASTRTANLNLAYGMSTPVTAFPANKTGFHDAQGSVWEWCEDHFNALPGFKVHPYYEDFSMPCFDGQHNMIMGGSFMSTGDEASRFSRFHFRPHFFQHAGFRVVEPNRKDPTLATSCMDNEGPYVGGDSPYRSGRNAEANRAQYEDQEWLQRYLHLHYPDVSDAESVPSYLPQHTLDFPRRCADMVISAARECGAEMNRALDLGCAVGGSTFALARAFREVHGIELSQAFVDAAKAMQQHGSLPYDIKSEGDVYSALVARVPEDVDASRVTFAQGDAMSVPQELGQFDAVLFANVLCRLPDPAACLQRLLGGEGAVLKPGGVMMLTTPFSWKPEFTPKESWLGGRVGSDGKTMKSIDGLKALMESLDMELLRQEDMPLTIRQHARLYELVITPATVWRSRA